MNRNKLFLDYQKNINDILFIRMIETTGDSRSFGPSERVYIKFEGQYKRYMRTRVHVKQKNSV